MRRVTVTIDDDLLSALDQYMETGENENRSEAVRDLLRAGLLKKPESENEARPCVGALVYVYDHGTRQLSRKLIRDHHHHVGMSVTVMHVHLNERSCLEVSILKGHKSQVERFANHLIGQQGVRYGRLVLIPKAEMTDA